ncbi:MAG: hypothetical protein U0O04_02155 [Clostridia bacterium]|nr:MAG TPA: hypothetical protein [Caudoviricetes sp.]HJJ06256.1 hypothetical protein [Clostridiaceae bacterium]
MENAVHGLKMAFGVIVFCLALTISFMLFGKIKTTRRCYFLCKK